MNRGMSDARRARISNIILQGVEDLVGNATSPRTIAQRLKKMGIRGEVQQRHTCPLAVYFRNLLSGERGFRRVAVAGAIAAHFSGGGAGASAEFIVDPFWGAELTARQRLQVAALKRFVFAFDTQVSPLFCSLAIPSGG